MQTSGLILPRTLALAFPFDESLRGFEDWDLVFCLAAVGVAIVYHPACLVRYHTAGTTAGKRVRWASEFAWLRRPTTPASTTARFIYYISVKARDHGRQDPVTMLTTAVWLYRATPHAGTILRRTLMQRWRQRRIRSRSGKASGSHTH